MSDTAPPSTSLASTDVVQCDKFRCKLQAAACVQRQRWEGRRTSTGTKVSQTGINAIHYAFCGSGKCLQGLGYAERLIDPSRKIRISPVASPAAMPAAPSPHPNRRAPFTLRPAQQESSMSTTPSAATTAGSNRTLCDNGCGCEVRPKAGALNPTCFKCRVLKGTVNVESFRKKPRRSTSGPVQVPTAIGTPDVPRVLTPALSTPKMQASGLRQGQIRQLVAGATNDELADLITLAKAEAKKRLEGIKALEGVL